MDKRCPRRLKDFPSRICPRGKKKTLRMRSGRFNVMPCKSNECVWYIDDKRANYCFFKYMSENAREHTLEGIAILTATSINNIKLRLDEALASYKAQLLKCSKDGQEDK